MGKSRTAVYQIGRVYKINGYMYLAISEERGIVTFRNEGLSFDNDKGVWANMGKLIQRKQRWR
jgi:hypothetical protein